MDRFDLVGLCLFSAPFWMMTSRIIFRFFFFDESLTRVCVAAAGRWMDGAEWERESIGFLLSGFLFFSNLVFFLEKKSSLFNFDYKPEKHIFWLLAIFLSNSFVWLFPTWSLHPSLAYKLYNFWPQHTPMRHTWNHVHSFLISLWWFVCVTLGFGLFNVFYETDSADLVCWLLILIFSSCVVSFKVFFQSAFSFTRLFNCYANMICVGSQRFHSAGGVFIFCSSTVLSRFLCNVAAAGQRK